MADVQVPNQTQQMPQAIVNTPQQTSSTEIGGEPRQVTYNWTTQNSETVKIDGKTTLVVNTFKNTARIAEAASDNSQHSHTTKAADLESALSNIRPVIYHPHNAAPDQGFVVNTSRGSVLAIVRDGKFQPVTEPSTYQAADGGMVSVATVDARANPELAANSPTVKDLEAATKHIKAVAFVTVADNETRQGFVVQTLNGDVLTQMLDGKFEPVKAHARYATENGYAEVYTVAPEASNMAATPAPQFTAGTTTAANNGFSTSNNTSFTKYAIKPLGPRGVA